MSDLKCTAENCLYNKQCHCDKDSVQVEGQSAKISEETCCKSFADRQADGK